jgi:hypothetical protein
MRDVEATHTVFVDIVTRRSFAVHDGALHSVDARISATSSTKVVDAGTIYTRCRIDSWRGRPFLNGWHVWSSEDAGRAAAALGFPRTTNPAACKSNAAKV